MFASIAGQQTAERADANTHETSTAAKPVGDLCDIFGTIIKVATAV
ncbi:MAG: hypothetical protein WCH39_00175 [Schlesneria sp.]